MGVMHRRRAGIVIIGAVLLTAVGAAFAIDRSTTSKPIEVRSILEEPATFCAVVHAQSFRARVHDVQRSVREDRAPRAATTIAVGFIRRAGRLRDTPPSLRGSIRRLATTIEAGAERGDLAEAEVAATEIDRTATRACK